MDHSKDEILQALKVIKDVCATHHCQDCPFADDEAVCVINGTNPNDWVIAAPDPVWRALYPD